MKTLIRFSTVKIRFLFHPFTSRKSLYVWHKLIYRMRAIPVFRVCYGYYKWLTKYYIMRNNVLTRGDKQIITVILLNMTCNTCRDV